MITKAEFNEIKSVNINELILTTCQTLYKNLQVKQHSQPDPFVPHYHKPLKVKYTL